MAEFPSSYTDLPTIYGTNNFASLLEDAMDWAHCNGLIMRSAENKGSSDITQIAPFSLIPSSFPRRLFDEAQALQLMMNELYFRVSWDIKLLVDSHRDVIKTDDFVRKMIEIIETIHKEGIKQKITLLTQRSDYMCHVEPGAEMTLKQIEVNNIAVSMGGLAHQTTKLHKRVLTKLEINSFGHVPENNPVRTLAEAIFEAWLIFNNMNACTLIIVDDVNQNQFDQRFVEYELERLSEGRMRIIRITLSKCYEKLSLDEEYSLKVDGLTVSIVYFRTGYTPDSYIDTNAWSARLMIEKSSAIKCPWIGLQLANTKKIQQILTNKGVIEKYFDSFHATQIRKVFAGLWGLENDDENSRQLIDDVLKSPSNYVLKPQLEGGAGNYFGDKIVEKLKNFTFEERAAHILMEKIKPLVVKNLLIRPFEKPLLLDVVSELGIYGSLLGNGENMKIILNKSHGHILRTKDKNINEGGVAVGASVVDTAYLL